MAAARLPAHHHALPSNDPCALALASLAFPAHCRQRSCRLLLCAGTRVPMFIVHKKGLQLDGSNPTL